MVIRHVKGNGQEARAQTRRASQQPPNEHP